MSTGLAIFVKPVLYCKQARSEIGRGFPRMEIPDDTHY